MQHPATGQEILAAASASSIRVAAALFAQDFATDQTRGQSATWDTLVTAALVDLTG
jgi:hypothetical protein